MKFKDIYNYIKLHGINNNNIYQIFKNKYSIAEIEFCIINYNDYLIDNSEIESNSIKSNRTKQSIFRDKIVNKFKKCIISEAHYTRCQACHIIPYASSDCKNKYNINNGLLLRADLHLLFDKYILSINPKSKCVEIKNYHLSIDPDLHSYNNKIIDCLNKENIKLLADHYKIFLSNNISIDK